MLKKTHFMSRCEFPVCFQWYALLLRVALPPPPPPS